MFKSKSLISSSTLLEDKNLSLISFGIVKFLDGVLQLNHIVKEYFKGTCGEINTKTPDPK